MVAAFETWARCYQEGFMLRRIHTADWQLCKPYSRFDSDVRAALSEARFDAINAIGKAVPSMTLCMSWSPATSSIPKGPKIA